MAKKVYKIGAFHGGINQRNDPRDIEENQLEDAFNVDVSNPGRITMPGDAKSNLVLKNVAGYLVSPSASGSPFLTNPITNGYGLFSFQHDFNINSTPAYNSGKPVELHTEFLCINDGAKIKIWDSCPNANDSSSSEGIWRNSLLSVGAADGSVKMSYYKAGSGMRVCDGNFGRVVLSGFSTGSVTSSATTVSVTVGTAFEAGHYIEIDSEIMKVISISNNTLTVKRAQFGTTADIHAGGANVSIVNVPKILTHIHRPLLEKSGANTIINRWLSDIQHLTPPDNSTLTIFPNADILSYASSTLLSGTLYPSSPENVFLGLQEVNKGDETFGFNAASLPNTESGTGLQQIINIPILQAGESVNVAAAGFAIGKMVIIKDVGGVGSVLNGDHEIVGLGNSIIKIANEAPTAYIATDYTSGAEITLETEVISDDLKNQYIFGMSYLYDGGSSVLQESSVTTGVIGKFYIAHGESIFNTVSNWKTAPDGLGSTSSFNEIESDNWDHEDGVAKAKDANNEWLVYQDSSNPLDVSSATEYYVSVTVDSYEDGSLEVYLAPDASFTTDSKLSIGAAGTYTAKISTQTDGTGSNIVGIKGLSTATLSISNIQVWDATPTVMSSTNAMDFRLFSNACKGTFSFLCNNSRTGGAITTQNNSWNERIEGFRIYMKQVDMIGGGLSEEWLLLYDANIKDGTYIVHAKDGDTETLRLGDISGSTWSATNTADARAVVTSNLDGDSIKNVPLLTYESEHGYPAETNTAAMYKTSAIIDRSVYIGNLKIGGRTYPDRMIRAPIDEFDTFPDDGDYYIDVATADGDDIVKLVGVGDKLIQFKTKNAFLIQVTSEGEDLLQTWSGAGISNPSHVCLAGKGVIWCNHNGLYFFDGEKMQVVTSDRFNSNNWKLMDIVEGADFDTSKVSVIGYDEMSNKVIINTTDVADTQHGGYIYDIGNNSFTKMRNLFNWYTIPPEIDTLDSIIGDQINDISISTPSTMTASFPIVAFRKYKGDSSANNLTTRQSTSVSAYKTNTVTMSNKKLVFAQNWTESLNPNITAWNDSPHGLWEHASSAEHFKIQTKDIDFGNPSRRKKIYKVYVTFKAGGYMSGVIAKYATNGSNTFDGTFADTTYYSNTKGFDSFVADGSSSTDWITVALKPSSSINNIYSLQLQFSNTSSVARVQYVAAQPSTSTITLDSNANSNNDYYNGMPLYIVSGPGEFRLYRVKNYVGNTKVATIDTVSDDVADTIPTGDTVGTTSIFDVGSIPEEFEINDISIVYREKPIK